MLSCEKYFSEYSSSESLLTWLIMYGLTGCIYLDGETENNVSSFAFVYYYCFRSDILYSSFQTIQDGSSFFSCVIAITKSKLHVSNEVGRRAFNIVADPWWTRVAMARARACTARRAFVARVKNGSSRARRKAGGRPSRRGGPPCSPIMATTVATGIRGEPAVDQRARQSE